MAKGYTDWIDIVCKNAEPIYQEALKAVPLDAIPLYHLKAENKMTAVNVATHLSMIYDNYRRAGFNPTSAQVRVRWLMQMLCQTSIEKTKFNIDDTFIPTTLDVADAIIDKAAANETAT